MAKRNSFHGLDQPLKHGGHRRPMTRRELIGQGFRLGAGSVMGASMFSLFANPRAAYATLAPDLEALKTTPCEIATLGAGKIPFICIDLAGGANISGSNVLVGGPGGQQDFLSTAGYNKLGLPSSMVPGTTEAAPTATSNGDHVDTTLGLAFHSDSAFLRGILEKAPTAVGNINGAVIPARSDNDTGNNPHNPMYGISMAGAGGNLVDLIGSRSTVSGGNSMAPSKLIDLSSPPTKIDRPSDVTGLVDTGDLLDILNATEAVSVMESIQRISAGKLAQVNAGLLAGVEENVSCQYVKSADITDRFSDPNVLNPDDRSAVNPVIVDDTSGIFGTVEFDSEREFRKTASVMKMVIDGFAGAGTIALGGYDYHTGDRATGEERDLRAGRCMGACLEYAAQKGVPLMLYVCSDGSVFSNGMIDTSLLGRDKGVWTGDNSSTAASFFLVYDPGSQPTLLGAGDEQFVHQQIGWMRADASVETANGYAPANNVNGLVDTVLLNYLALHGEAGNFAGLFGNGLGSNLDRYTAFQTLSSISNGVIS